MSLVCHFFEWKEVDWTLMAGTGLEQEKKGKGDGSLGCRETTHPPPPSQPAFLSSGTQSCCCLRDQRDLQLPRSPHILPHKYRPSLGHWVFSFGVYLKH